MNEQLDHMSEAQREAAITEMAGILVRQSEMATLYCVRSGAWLPLYEQVLASRIGGAA